jgi:hypothetical protein
VLQAAAAARRSLRPAVAVQLLPRARQLLLLALLPDAASQRVVSAARLQCQLLCECRAASLLAGAWVPGGEGGGGALPAGPSCAALDWQGRAAGGLCCAAGHLAKGSKW